ncbi:hypothetical protein [Thermococcus gammatolerans]|uniref:hypothetical protein n=1 Tax=Thermococcus gammatolerans TaxID=187878 RepID=UPI0011D0EA96|nr:hypothetical protein [Thermococcus gammatolerans]
MRAMTQKGRKRRNRSGPGRPPVFDEPVYTAFWMEKEDKERLYEQKGTLPVGVYVGMLLRSKSAEKAILMRQLAEKDRLLEEKDRCIEELEKLVERLQDELEKWRFRAEACEKNKPKLSSKWSKILLAIPKAVEEGLTWNDLMRDLGILDPQEQVAVMQRFFITIDENGKIPEVIKPLQGIKELEGIVLYRENGVNVRFAKIVREDTLKAAKSLRVEAPKPAKKGRPAVKVSRAEIEKSLKAWLKQYEQWASNWRTKEKAEQFLKSVGNNGLRRLVREYGFDVVAEVVGSNADYRALFGPFLLKLQEKKVEVKA